MKTAELTGAALDWAVCKAKGEYQCPVDEYTAVWMTNRRYSTDWLLGGPIIERECIGISCIHITGYTPDSWDAKHPQRIYSKGTTPLIAAMRCYVASKMGDEIEIPTELTKGEDK